MDDRLRLCFSIRFDSLIAEVKAFWPENVGEILGLLEDKLRREAAKRRLELSDVDNAGKQDNKCIKEEVKDEDVQAGPSTSRGAKRSRPSRQVATKKARYLKTEASKKYACRFDGCGRSFQCDSNLAIHERIHLNVKPFSCTMADCGFESKVRGHVARHIRQVHWRIPSGFTTTDDRDPDQYIAVNEELLARRLP